VVREREPVFFLFLQLAVSSQTPSTPTATPTPTRNTSLPNISPSTSSRTYQTLGPPSTVQHLRYRRLAVAVSRALWSSKNDIFEFTAIPKCKDQTFANASGVYNALCHSHTTTLHCLSLSSEAASVCTCALRLLQQIGAPTLRGCRQLRRGAVRLQRRTRPATKQRACCTWDENSFWFSPQKVLFHLFFAS
jgi:hypothetical protein